MTIGKTRKLQLVAPEKIIIKDKIASAS